MSDDGSQHRFWPSRRPLHRFEARLSALWLITSTLGCGRAPAPTNDPAMGRVGSPVEEASTGATAPSASRATAGAGASATSSGFVPKQVRVEQKAMGTRVEMVAYTSAELDEAATKAAMSRAFDEMGRLEKVLSEWLKDSEVSAINDHAGEPVHVGTDTFACVSKGIWAGSISEGTFDLTFQTMGDLWKFGDAAEKVPHVPDAAEVEKRKKLVDYRKVKLDRTKHTVTIAKGTRIGLGGIAKGYIVDQASGVLRSAGVRSFLVQAGGDLFGSGRKPDGSPWVSGIQDPRGPHGSYFALIELTDHAFSTAGDYARSFVVDGKRYHHIIDPRTGYPATESRSVTVWAPDAFTADAVDDGVFILGPQKGLALVESLDGVGAVIVDKTNKVFVSKRLEGKVHILKQPTDGL